MNSIAQHSEPVWRSKSDFVLAAEVMGADSDLEQLAVRQLAPFQFEICCIPFFLYGVSLGDVVETDDEYLLQNVIERSGRYVFRVWFGETAYPRDQIAHALTNLGGLLEWSSLNLLAVDAENPEVATRISDFLTAAASEEKLLFETGGS